MNALRIAARTSSEAVEELDDEPFVDFQTGAGMLIPRRYGE